MLLSWLSLSSSESDQWLVLQHTHTFMISLYLDSHNIFDHPFTFNLLSHSHSLLLPQAKSQRRGWAKKQGALKMPHHRHSLSLLCSQTGSITFLNAVPHFIVTRWLLILVLHLHIILFMNLSLYLPPPWSDLIPWSSKSRSFTLN